MDLSIALNWVSISLYLSACQPVCHSIGLVFSFVSVFCRFRKQQLSLLKQRTLDMGSSKNKNSWFLYNLACSLINYPGIGSRVLVIFALGNLFFFFSFGSNGLDEWPVMIYGWYVILKEPFLAIYTSFMIILHYAIMIDFKNITRWKKLTW